MLPSNARCGRCRYFDTSITDEDGMRSPCRINPPLVPFAARSPAGEWPFVDEADWCGAFVFDQANADADDEETSLAAR